MGYYVRYDDLRGVNEITGQQITLWNEQLLAIQQSIQNIIGMDSFQGATAESIKAYYSEVQIMMLVAIGSVLTDFASKCALYWDGYYAIDGDIHTKLNEDTLNKAIREYNYSLEELGEAKSRLDAAISSISDIFYPGTPSCALLERSHEDAIEATTALRDEVQPYENSILNGDLKSLEELINTTRALICDYKNGSRDVMIKYTSGDIGRNENIGTLCSCINEATKYRQEHEGDLLTAAEKQQEVYVQLQEEYEAAMAEARTDQGIAQMITGGVALIVGGAAIVLSMGAATPAVVAGIAAVSGTCTTMFAISELEEGAQHIYYGLNGDPYTSAINPLRDTIFCGNQELYSAWGNLNMTVAGVCLPVGYATQGMQGMQLIQTGAKVLVKETVTELAAEGAANFAVPWLADQMSIDSMTGQTLLNLGFQIAAEGGIEKGVDYAGKGVNYLGGKLNFQNFNGDLTATTPKADGGNLSWENLMSPEDAALYSKFVDESIAGTHNPHPGLDDISLRAWETADAKLNDIIAQGKVDGDAILALRIEELQRLQMLEESTVAGEIGVEGSSAILSYEDAEYIAFDAIHGSNKADAVVLGKYGDGGPTAYTSIAKDMDAQYFQLDNWDELASKYSDDEIWKINEKFLDIQTSSGREIFLSHNPEDYLGKGQFYSRELRYLLDNGYRFVDEGGIWRAIR